MADDRLRTLERAAPEDPEARARLLVERVRTGSLAPWTLEAAAACCHRPALLALGRERDLVGPIETLGRLTRCPRDLWVVAAFGAVSRRLFREARDAAFEKRWAGIGTMSGDDLRVLHTIALRIGMARPEQASMIEPVDLEAARSWPLAGWCLRALVGAAVELERPAADDGSDDELFNLCGQAIKHAHTVRIGNARPDQVATGMRQAVVRWALDEELLDV